MMRVLVLAGGLFGAAALSQYPAFTQQYVQRLAGQVDALTEVVRDFDNSALAAGLGRQDALDQMSGTAFLDARQDDMRRTFARQARLSDNLSALRAAGPVARLGMPQRLADPETLSATWSDFEPALPLSIAGAASAGVGFFMGSAVLASLLAIGRAPFRRRRSQPTRTEPRITRPQPQLVQDRVQPRLGGVRR